MRKKQRLLITIGILAVLAGLAGLFLLSDLEIQLASGLVSVAGGLLLLCVALNDWLENLRENL